MTTKVSIQCPPDSHWNLSIRTEDKRHENDNHNMPAAWADAAGVVPVVLDPGSEYSTYLTSTRRIVVEEVERVVAEVEDAKAPEDEFEPAADAPAKEIVA